MEISKKFVAFSEYMNFISLFKPVPGNSTTLLTLTMNPIFLHSKGQGKNRKVTLVLSKFLAYRHLFYGTSDIFFVNT